MVFDIITLFPEVFETYFQQSLIKKAKDKKIIKINILDLRDFSSDKHRTVDDKPFGGGRGMVLKLEPIYRAVKSLRKQKNRKTKVILFTPRGKNSIRKWPLNLSN